MIIRIIDSILKYKNKLFDLVLNNLRITLYIFTMPFISCVDHE